MASRIAGYALAAVILAISGAPAMAQKAAKAKQTELVPSAETALTADQLYQFLVAEIASQRANGNLRRRPMPILPARPGIQPLPKGRSK